MASARVTLMADSHLEGAAELARQLAALGDIASTKIMRAAVRAAIQPAKKKAQATIPVGLQAHRTYKGRLVAPGFSKRSIRVVTKVSRDGKSISAALGVQREAFYAVLFEELGTSKMPARPWLRPAMASTVTQQQAILVAQLRDRIQKAINNAR